MWNTGTQCLGLPHSNQSARNTVVQSSQSITWTTTRMFLHAFKIVDFELKIWTTSGQPISLFHGDCLQTQKNQLLAERNSDEITQKNQHV